MSGKQVANKLGKSTGKQREDVDKAPINGKIRAIYNNKIETDGKCIAQPFILA